MAFPMETDLFATTSQKANSAFSPRCITVSDKGSLIQSNWMIFDGNLNLQTSTTTLVLYLIDSLSRASCNFQFEFARASCKLQFSFQMPYKMR